VEKAEQYQLSDEIRVMDCTWSEQKSSVNEFSMKLQGIGDVFSDVKVLCSETTYCTNLSVYIP
jgi:hypothetical protein